MRGHKKQTVCNTVGKGIFAVVLTYACCVALASILLVISCIADPSSLGVTVAVVVILITLVSFGLALVTYRFLAGFVAFDETHVVIRQPGKKPGTHPASDLQSATLDAKGALTVSLRDGTTYKLGKMAANVHKFLAFAAQYTDQH